MSEHTNSLTTRFRGRSYSDLILEHQNILDEESLSDETFRLLGDIRPQVRQHAEEVYELYLDAPRSRLDFFGTPTKQQIAEIVHTVKRHYLFEHDILIKESEAVAIAHIVTLNFARMCHMNDSFKQHLKNSRRRSLFRRLIR